MVFCQHHYKYDWYSIKNWASSEWEAFHWGHGLSLSAYVYFWRVSKISAACTKNQEASSSRPTILQPFHRIAAWLRQRFLIPPPSFCFALSSPLRFLPLEPIHWLEQCLTERSLITMTQNPACFDLQLKHAPPAGSFHSCTFCQLPFFSPPWSTCVVWWFENVCVKFCKYRCRNIVFDCKLTFGSMLQ